MNVQQFVSQNLREILASIDELGDPRVAPDVRSANVGPQLRTDGGRVIYPVEFDIAVTVSETSERGGGAGLTVFSVGQLKGNINNSQLQQAVSRVKFTVPLDLSMSPEERRQRADATTNTNKANGARRTARL